jgi:methionine biosynthesis protein MetW
MQSGYYSNARKEIAPLLPKFVSSVLELGCGEGNTLEWLRNTLSVKHCVGVEVNRAAAVSARNKGLVVHNVNVEEEALPLTGEQFDLLLCLDVLEHLREPWRVLPVLLAHLRPGGSVIVSIPNVAHVSALLPLIFQNEWQYQLKTC